MKRWTVPGATAHDPRMPGFRIASLLASATEIVCALGARDSLIARSHECDFPPDVVALPAVTAAKIDANRPSAEIDRQVRSLVADALSVYRVDAETLRRLAPDVIVTQTQCEVCAVSFADVEHALADWIDARPRIVSLAPNALGDMFDDVARVASALDRAEAGAALVSRMKARMARVAARAAWLSPKPRVAAIEWIEPLMAAGNWMPELIAMAGGINLFGKAGKHSPWMTFAELAAADPDVMLVLPCGFDIARCRREMPALTEMPGWATLAAVRAGKVFLLDGNQYFNRPGPRLVDSLEILAEVFHPGRFDIRHEGHGWVRL